MTAQLHKLRVVIDQSAGLQVLLVDRGEADAFTLLDSEGEPLPVVLRRGDERTAFARAPLVDGRSELLQAPSGATRLQLWKDGEVVRETELRLEPGTLVRVRP